MSLVDAGIDKLYYNMQLSICLYRDFVIFIDKLCWYLTVARMNCVQVESGIMAGNKCVVVLAPNGRRQNVKVTPNTTILQVRE
jgi:hypothetical protein